MVFDDKKALDTYDVAVADMNGDGKPDIITANSGGLNLVYLNPLEWPAKTPGNQE